MSHLLGGPNTGKEAIVDVSNGNVLLCKLALMDSCRVQRKSVVLKSYLLYFSSLSVKDSPPSTLLGIAYEDRFLMLHDI